MDEFDDMLNAIDHVLNNGSPYWRDQELSEPQIPLPQTKSYTSTGYVPLDRIDMVLDRFTSNNATTSQYTNSQYKNDLSIINRILEKYPQPLHNLEYSNDLYPEIVMATHKLSKTIHWPRSVNVDMFIEHTIKEWIYSRTHKTDYLQDLFFATKDQNCYANTLLRLNLNVRQTENDDTIIIRTARPGHPRNTAQSVVVKQNKTHGTLSKNARDKIIELLKNKQAYLKDHDEIKSHMQKLQGACSDEQSIIGLICFIVIKTMADNPQNGWVPPNTLRIEKH